jgi:hypothetical protein
MEYRDRLSSPTRNKSCRPAGDALDIERSFRDDRLSYVSSHLDADIEWARWATERWADFPVGQIPRPLVLVEPGIRVEHGFSGPAKVTFGVGAVDGDESVPNAVLDVLRTPRLSVDRLPSRANV